MHQKILLTSSAVACCILVALAITLVTSPTPSNAAIDAALPAADASDEIVPPYSAVAVSCWEGGVEVVYEAIAISPPSWKRGAWQLTLTNQERVLTTAPCRLILGPA